MSFSRQRYFLRNVGQIRDSRDLFKEVEMKKTIQKAWYDEWFFINFFIVNSAIHRDQSDVERLE